MDSWFRTLSDPKIWLCPGSEEARAQVYPGLYCILYCLSHLAAHDSAKPTFQPLPSAAAGQVLKKGHCCLLVWGWPALSAFVAG